ncbi:MAG: response regulator [Proteobacteria bacterium]|nr:response regulator [Pseudomonadota bacterium]
MRILVVDDELVSRKKMRRIMSNFGDCDMAENGRQALAAFESSWERLMPYDLLMLDIHMPELDGTEVLKTIRQREAEMGVAHGAGLRIVMVTAVSDGNMVSSSLASGCDEYIVKPFDILTVTEKIRRLFVDDPEFRDLGPDNRLGS